jgi:hypothetical protein
MSLKYHKSDKLEKWLGRKLFVLFTKVEDLIPDEEIMVFLEDLTEKEFKIWEKWVNSSDLLKRYERERN